MPFSPILGRKGPSLFVSCCSAQQAEDSRPGYQEGSSYSRLRGVLQQRVAEMDPAALAAGPAAARGDLRSAGWRHAEVSGRVGGNSGPNPLPPKASAGQRQQLRRRQSVGLGRPAGAPALLGSNAIAGLGAARLLSPSPHPQLPARQRKPTRCSSEVSAEAAPGSAPSPTDTSAHDTSLQATPPLDTSPLDTSAPSLLPLGPIATSSGRETARLMAEAQDWEAALRLLRGLQQQQGPGAAEAIHFNILLNLAGQAQQWELLERTYDEMMSTPEGAGARPDNYTFSTLISSSIRCVAKGPPRTSPATSVSMHCPRTQPCKSMTAMKLGNSWPPYGDSRDTWLSRCHGCRHCRFQSVEGCPLPSQSLNP